MATILICNNDVQSALRALKKELQKEGVFRLAKAKKTFKNSHELKQERMVEIVRRKIKDKHENKANNAYRGVSEQKSKPFVFKIQGYTMKIYNDGKVLVYKKNTKINEVTLDKADFDNIETMISANPASSSNESPLSENTVYNDAGNSDVIEQNEQSENDINEIEE